MSYLISITNKSDHNKLYIHDDTNNNNMYFQYEAKCNNPSIVNTKDSGQVFQVKQTPTEPNNIQTIYNPSSGGFLASTGKTVKVGAYDGESAGTITFLPSKEADKLTFTNVTGSTTDYYISITSGTKKLYLTYDQSEGDVSFLDLVPTAALPFNLSVTWFITILNDNIAPE